FPEWDDWHHTAFERSNAHMFLKLATWIMYRFRLLTHDSPVDAPVDGLLIPDHPANYVIESEADYNEALGMTRLYAGLANIDTHPEHLCHIFHELGKAAYEGRLESSHPGLRPMPEPPIPVESTTANEEFPWLRAAPCHDSDRSDEMDVEGNVDDVDGDASISTALDDMVISREQRTTGNDLRDSLKRKRTMSKALSPPKVDGGRGYPKRLRANITEAFLRPSSPHVRPQVTPSVSITVTKAPTGGKDITIEDIYPYSQGRMSISHPDTSTPSSSAHGPRAGRDIGCDTPHADDTHMHTPSTSNVGHALAGPSIETTGIDDALDVYQPVATVAGDTDDTRALVQQYGWNITELVLLLLTIVHLWISYITQLVSVLSIIVDGWTQKYTYSLSMPDLFSAPRTVLQSVTVDRKSKIPTEQLQERFNRWKHLGDGGIKICTVEPAGSVCLWLIWYRSRSAEDTKKPSMPIAIAPSTSVAIPTADYMSRCQSDRPSAGANGTIKPSDSAITLRIFQFSVKYIETQRMTHRSQIISGSMSVRSSSHFKSLQQTPARRSCLSHLASSGDVYDMMQSSEHDLLMLLIIKVTHMSYASFTDILDNPTSNHEAQENPPRHRLDCIIFSQLLAIPPYAATEAQTVFLQSSGMYSCTSTSPRNEAAVKSARLILDDELRFMANVCITLNEFRHTCQLTTYAMLMQTLQMSTGGLILGSICTLTYKFQSSVVSYEDKNVTCTIFASFSKLNAYIFSDLDAQDVPLDAEGKVVI
ncbi:hypothetical protein EV702DRAFT_1052472, partial [Suillus placidus]